jgi:hypothetical protein|tara:strand:- start:119 stop:607 length:489 start_codon:yes stop_codon:yes gene_type:complete
MARKAVGNVGTQARPQSSSIMQQLKRFNLHQGKKAKPAPGIVEKSATPIARMPKAAKTDKPKSVVPRGPKGIAPPPQQDFMKKRRQMQQKMPGGFTYGRSARGAMGSRGRANPKQFGAQTMQTQQALPMQRQGQMSLLGRQYSKGGLLKSASKLSTGIKSGK